MMKETGVVLVVTLLGACAGEPATAPQDVRAQVERTMGAFASMDQEGFLAELTDDVLAFEMDLEGKPVRLGSRDEVAAWAEAIFAELKEMGASMRLDFGSTDCHANAALAYCTVEFDLTATMADGNTMAQPTRNTVVLRRGDAGWKWMHWHSSLSVLPAPPALP